MISKAEEKNVIEQTMSSLINHIKPLTRIAFSQKDSSVSFFPKVRGNMFSEANVLLLGLLG
jgi:hypothetical protein